MLFTALFRFKTLIIFTILTLGSSQTLHAQNSCDVELQAGFTLDETELSFFESKNKSHMLYSIHHNNQLTVNDKNITLNTAQQALVKEYANSIRAMVPKVRQIAIEGVDLAISGISSSFNELLGEGNQVGTDVTKELSALKNELAARYTLKNGFTIGENGLDDDELFGEDIEQRIESAIEKTIMNSMGNILIALGKEISATDGQHDLARRIEQFSENIEKKMTLGAEKIERKADSLCSEAIAIDQLEEKLKSTIAALANINVITAKSVSLTK